MKRITLQGMGGGELNAVALPKLYTETDLANYLEVSEDTVARERRRGRLGYTLVAKKIRFTDQHIQEYLRSRECTATSGKGKTTGSGTSGSTTTPTDNAANVALALGIARKPSKPLQSTS